MVTREEMVERIARGLCRARRGNPDAEEYVDGKTTLPAWTAYQDIAEDALNASGLWPVYEAARNARPALVTAISCHTSLDWTDERTASEELGRALTAMEGKDD